MMALCHDLNTEPFFMKFSKRTIGLVAVVIASAGVAVASYAATAQANDALSIADAKLSLSQAVSIAEQHQNGKATRAEFERTKGVNVFDVEVVSGSGVFDVVIDAEKGAVISSNADKNDNERHEHEDD
jgi:uncharacterized membrane protein YkoI